MQSFFCEYVKYKITEVLRIDDGESIRERERELLKIWENNLQFQTFELPNSNQSDCYQLDHMLVKGNKSTLLIQS